MTVPYKSLSGAEITFDQLDEACSAVISTLSGAHLILRVFAENGDEDTTDLCNALEVLLSHVGDRVADIQPAVMQPVPLKASLPDMATAHTGAGEGRTPSNPQGKNRGRS